MSDEMSETKKIGLWLNVYQSEDGIKTSIHYTKEDAEIEALMVKRYYGSMTVFAKAVPVDSEEGYNPESEEKESNE